jgi:fucose permease
MFVFGLILGLPGTVLGLAEVAVQFQLTLADRGTLISTLFVGLLLGSVASGPLVDAAGQRASLAISAALVALCLPLLAAATSFALAAAAMGALGLAAAGMNTAANALSSDLFPHERGRRMNGIALVVGFGGLAMPLATALGAGTISWRTVVHGGAALAGLVALAGALASTPAATTSGSGLGARSAFRTVSRQPGFVWFGLLLMLGAATEAAMAGWTSTFLTVAGFSPEGATWALSSHWLGLIAGRVIFSRRVDRLKDAAIARAAVCGAACLLVFVALPWTAVLVTGPFAIGLAIAVIVPTSLAFAGDRYPGNAGTLFGVLLTLAQVGGIVVPALIGLIAERAGVRAGLSVLVVNCLVVASVSRRAARASRR